MRSELARSAAIGAAAVLLLTGCGDESEDRDVTSTASAPPATTTETAPAPAPPAGDEPPSDAEKPEKPIERIERPLAPPEVTRAVLTRSGSVEQGCEELVTESFVADAYGDLQGCLAAREAGGQARSLSKTNYVATSDRTIGTVIPRGGPYDDIEVTVELVSDPAHEGGWLVDSLRADVPAGP